MVEMNLNLLSNKRMGKNKAFTLIEVMLTLIIFAFFLMLSIPSLNANAKRKQLMQNEILSYTCDDISPNCMACKHGNCIACTNSCGDAHFLNVEDCSCSDCPENCSGCSKNECINCKLGYTLKEGECVEDNSLNVPKENVNKTVKKLGEALKTQGISENDIQQVYIQSKDKKELKELMQELNSITNGTDIQNLSFPN